MYADGLAYNEDTKSLIFTDAVNNRVRTIDSFGIIHTICGTGVSGYNGDGILATNATIDYPVGLDLDNCGNIYFGDTRNNRVRKITFDSTCNTHTLSLPSEASGANLKFYPNPTYDVLHIDNVKTPTTYTLLNIVGAVIQKGTLQTGENNINLQSLRAGVYMLEITSEHESGVYRVLKE